MSLLGQNNKSLIKLQVDVTVVMFMKHCMSILLTAQHLSPGVLKRLQTILALIPLFSCLFCIPLPNKSVCISPTADVWR